VSSALLGSGIALAAACGGTSPGGQTPDPDESCFDGQTTGRTLPVKCNATCTARGTETARCVGGRWEVNRIDADCSLCPTALAPELVGCALEHIRVSASQLSARDGCAMRLRCGTTKVETWCDGENDGTGTSLCECARDGVRDDHRLQNPYQGEAPDACLAAAVRCKTPRT
jgi:hypothetical protein